MQYRYRFAALFVLIMACLFLFLSFYQHAKKDAINDLNMRQMIFAKQAVTGIEEYFNHWITLLTAAAQRDSLVNLDDRGKEQMDFILRSHGQGVRGISRLDQDGRILHTIPFDAKVIGSDLSGQKHVQEIMRTHKPVLSGVFSLVQGYRAVALHVPVFKGKKFSGTIAISFDFAVISRIFLEEIVIGETGYAWIVDEEGIELYCPVPGHTGKSVFDNCRDFPTILSMAKEMVKGKQGITTYFFDRIGDRKPELIRKHAVYVPVRIANTFWSIVVATSEEEVLASLQGFRNRLIGIIALLFLGSLLFSYYALKAWGIVREEGKRLSVEKALRENEERYRNLYDEAPVGYHELDTEGRIVRVNCRELQLLGYSADDMVGAYIWDFAVEKETSTRVTQEMLTGISPPSKGLEGSYRRKDGTTLTLRIDNVLLRDADGRITGIRSALSDITERKTAEEALRASEVQYRELHQSMMDAFASADMEGRIIDCNDAYLNMLGYSRDEIGRLTYRDITPEKWHGFEEALVKGSLLTKGYTEIYEKEYRRKDGTIFPVELRATLLRDQTGTPVSMWAIVRDITQRRRAEEMLRENEDKYRSLFDNSIDAILLTAPDGAILEANREASRIFGCPEEEICLVGREGLLDQNDPRLAAALEERTRTGRFRGELTFVRKDGTHFTGEIATSLFKARDGQPRTSVIIRDMTEKRKVEQDYRTLFREMLDGFAVHQIICDDAGQPVDYRFLTVNPAFERMTGLKAEQIIGRTVLEVLPGTERRWIEIYGRVALTGEPASFEEYTKALDKHFSVTAFQPAPNQFACIFVDITERMRAQEDRLRLAAAIEQSGEMVVMTDKEGIIQYVNPAFERITGYPREEAVGKKPRILKSGRHDRDFYQGLWDTLTAGGTWQGRFVNKKKNGGLFEEEARISPIRNLSGKITHYVAVKHDVTEQLKTEKQLFQAQKMEAIGTMAGGIAHDFNNILGAISGYTEISLAKIPSDSRIKYYLEQIHASSQRAIDLVRQILEFSRLTENERTSIRLIPLIKQTTKLLREIIPSTIEIHLDIRTDADTVLGDATQIYQILMNLCTNAYHAMKDRGGLLEIDLVRIEVGEDDLDEKVRGLSPGAYVELIVKDTGEGIDPMIKEKIFDPFFTTKKIGEGTGLGLSVVHGIVKSYNGKITVESRVGKGSAFYVSLPLLVAQPEVSPREPERPDMDGQGRILLVDDETILANMTKELLEDRGYTVIAKSDSVDALETFRADPDQFDLVITDQTMPVMTGLDLAEWVISIRNDIPVILCTGFIDSTIEEKASEAGIRAVVLKPIAMKRLMPLIQNLLALAG